jgi:hypothetical protein
MHSALSSQSRADMKSDHKTSLVVSSRPLQRQGKHTQLTPLLNRSIFPAIAECSSNVERANTIFNFNIGHSRHPSMDLPPQTSMNVNVIVYGKYAEYLMAALANDYQKIPKKCVCDIQATVHFYQSDFFNHRYLYMLPSLPDPAPKSCLSDGEAKEQQEQLFRAQYKRDFANSYILAANEVDNFRKVDPKLYYVNTDGVAEQVNVNIDTFIRVLAKEMKITEAHLEVSEKLCKRLVAMKGENLNRECIRRLISSVNKSHKPFSDNIRNPQIVIVCTDNKDIEGVCEDVVKKYENTATRILYVMPGEEDICIKGIIGRESIMQTMLFDKDYTEITKLFRISKINVAAQVNRFFNELQSVCSEFFPKAVEKAAEVSSPISLKK